MTLHSTSFVVAQKGAREHYAVSRALHARGMLAALVTDCYGPNLKNEMSRLLQLCGTRAVRKAFGRRAVGIPDQLVRSCSLRSIAWTIAARIRARRQGPYAGHLLSDHGFACWVARLQLPAHHIFFGYSYASLEALQVEKERGVFTILDQFDAAAVHGRLATEEARKWPDYTDLPPPVPDAYYNRVRKEWSVADLIVTNSDWTRSALLAQGVPESKIEIIPLAYDPPPSACTLEPRRAPSLPLRVLWVGSVNVAKGIPYLVEAARMLQGEPIEFTVAGGLRIKRKAIDAAPNNIRWLGQVPRNEVHELYRTHHVFALPTISDNFATVQLEALAHGMPVIVTSNCGHVIRHEETGFVIPPFCGQSLAEKLLCLLKTPTLLEEMSPRCIQAAKTYSGSAYGDRLVQIARERGNGRSQA